MAARIIEVMPGSPAYKAGVRPGEMLCAINGMEIRDVLDYKFHSYESRLTLSLDGRETVIEKGEGEDLGLSFESYLMDKERSCANKCVFCFIDQLPKGMRETLYFKTTTRACLSLWELHYAHEFKRHIERITDMRLSPINVSVHATDPEIRRFMLGNKRAGECFDILKKFAEGNISLNCQIVICPGINDGDVLSRRLLTL